MPAKQWPQVNVSATGTTNVTTPAYLKSAIIICRGAGGGGSTRTTTGGGGGGGGAYAS
jgi:hypothetical protein